MSKKAGGPNTPEGKSKISQNAIKHGLSTSQASNPFEKNNIELYAQDLIAHYKAEDPLEILQMQRIALYREKLAKAYQAEIAQEQLVIQDLENNPEAVFAKMPSINPVSKGMAREFIIWKKWTLPLDLTAEGLSEICLEIKSLSLAIHSEKEFTQIFPCLTQFLECFTSSRAGSDVSVMKKLEEVSDRLTTIFANGKHYGEAMKKLYEALEMLKANQRAAKLEDTTGEDELIRHIQETQEEMAAAKRARKSYFGGAERPPSRPSESFP